MWKLVGGVKKLEMAPRLLEARRGVLKRAHTRGGVWQRVDTTGSVLKRLETHRSLEETRGNVWKRT